MKKTSVLVLGNDPQINEIDFSRIQPDIITLGLNRIWLKMNPSYFFFNDLIIANELASHPEALAKLRQHSIIFSSDWIHKGKAQAVPKWITVHPRENRYLFPDSATNSIELLKKKYLPTSECVFYLAGISLTWKEPSHFWKSPTFSSKNTADSTWYLPRFEKMFDNFKTLKSKGYNIVSVTPNSKLNKLFRYESIENLYSKRL